MKKHVFVLLVLLAAGQIGTAQSLDSTVVPALFHKASLEVLRTLEKVRENARMKNDIEAYRYRNFFVKDVQLANEILPSNAFNQQVSLEEYTNNMMMYDMGGTMTTYSFRPYNLNLIKIEDDSTLVFEVDVVKEFGQLSTENLFYRTQMDLHYVVEIDKGLKKALVRESRLNQPKGKFLRIDISDGMLKDKGFNRILVVNGDSVKIAEGKTVVLSDVAENQVLNVASTSSEYLGSYSRFIADGAIGANARLGEEIITVHFRPKRFYLGAHYEMGSLNDDFTIPSNHFDTKAVSGSQAITDVRILAGYRLMNKRDRLFLALDARAGMRSFTGSYTATEHRSSYESVDADGDVYTHGSSLRSLTESTSAQVIYAGLGLNLQYKLWKYLSLGAFISYNAGLSNTGSFSLQAQSASYWGTYAQYGNLSLYDVEEYGFVSDQTLGVADDELVMQSLPNWLQAGVSIDIHLNQRLSLEIIAQNNSGSAVFAPNQSEIISSALNVVDYAMVNIAESRSWGFLSFGFGLKYYL